MVGDVVRDLLEIDQLVYSPIWNRKVVVGHKKSGREVTREIYSAQWDPASHGCSSTVGVFERGEAAAGHMHAVYFKQAGM